MDAVERRLAATRGSCERSVNKFLAYADEFLSPQTLKLIADKKVLAG